LLVFAGLAAAEPPKGRHTSPLYELEPPDILLVQVSEALGLKGEPLESQHLVRPDGTIGLGHYGSVFVAGMTLDQATDAIAAALKARGIVKNLSVEQIKRELQLH